MATPAMVQHKETASTNVNFTSGSVSVSTNALTTTPTVGHWVAVLISVSPTSGTATWNAPPAVSGWTNGGTVSENFSSNLTIYYKQVQTGDTGAISFSWSATGTMTKANVIAQVVEMSNVVAIDSVGGWTQSYSTTTLTSSELTVALNVCNAGDVGVISSLTTSASGTIGSLYYDGYYGTISGSFTSGSSTRTATTLGGIWCTFRGTMTAVSNITEAQHAVPNTPTIVQHTPSSGTTTSGTSVTITASSSSTTPTIGNYMFAFASYTGNGISSPMTTPTGWTLINSHIVSNETYIYLMRKLVASGDTGGFSATVAPTTAQAIDYAIEVFECSNVSGTVSYNYGNVVSSTQTLSLAPTSPGALQILVYVDAVNGSLTVPTSGWVASDSPSHTGGAQAVYMSTFTGPINPGLAAQTVTINNTATSYPNYYGLMAYPTITPVSNADSLSFVYTPAKTYSQTILANNPVAYYHLDDTATTAVNSGTAGSVTNGTIGSGITKSVTGLISGSTDTAMSFPGGAYNANNHIVVPVDTSNTPSNVISIEFLVNLAALPTYPNNWIACGRASTGGTFGYAIYQAVNGTLTFAISNNAAALVSNTALAASTTYHVVAVYDGSRLSLYINGALDNSTSYVGSITGYDGTDGLVIGEHYASQSDSIHGTLDEISIYHAALNSAQVYNHYQAAQHNFINSTYAPFTETYSFSDTVGRTSNVSRSFTDSVTTTQTITGLRALQRTLTDTVTVSDSMSSLRAFTRALADSLNTGDSTSGVKSFTRLSSDSLITGDTISRGATYGRAQTETFNTTDTITGLRSFIRSMAESISTSDSMTRNMSATRLITDALATIDNLNRITQMSRLLTDSISTADALSVNKAFKRQPSDGFSTSDSVFSPTIRNRNLTDTLSTSDNLSRVVNNLRMLNDLLSTIDVLGSNQSHTRLLNDSLNTNDGLSRGAAYQRVATDSFATSDGLNRLVTVTRLFTDVLTTSDTVSAVRVIFRTLAEALSTSDSAMRNTAVTRLFTDTTTTSDAVSKAAGLFRSLAESLNTADAVARNQTVSRILADTLITGAFLSDGGKYIIASLVDTLLTSDSISRSQNFTRTFSDILSTADSVQALRAIIRALTNTSSTSDVINKNMQYARLVDDILVTIDQVDRTVAITKALNELLQTTDTVNRLTQLNRILTNTSVASDSISGARSIFRGASESFTLFENVVNGRIVNVSVSDAYTLTESLVQHMMVLRAPDEYLPLSEAVVFTGRFSGLTFDLRAAVTFLPPNVYNIGDKVYFFYNGAKCYAKVVSTFDDPNTTDTIYIVDIYRASSWSVLPSPQLKVDVSMLVAVPIQEWH